MMRGESVSSFSAFPRPEAISVLGKAGVGSENSSPGELTSDGLSMANSFGSGVLGAAGASLSESTGESLSTGGATAIRSSCSFSSGDFNLSASRSLSGPAPSSGPEVGVAGVLTNKGSEAGVADLLTNDESGRGRRLGLRPVAVVVFGGTVLGKIGKEEADAVVGREGVGKPEPVQIGILLAGCLDSCFEEPDFEEFSGSLETLSVVLGGGLLAEGEGDPFFFLGAILARLGHWILTSMGFELMIVGQNGEKNQLAIKILRGTHLFEHGFGQGELFTRWLWIGFFEEGKNIEGAGSGECTFKALSNNTMEIKEIETRKICFKMDKEVLFDLRIK
jgi:hypothetical protein